MTYYLAPPNVYLTAAAGIAYDGGRNAGGVAEPDDSPLDRFRRRPRDLSRVAAEPGVGLDVDIGKEYWVGDDWGIGPALRIGLRQLDHSGRGGPFMSSVLAVFSATYQ